MLDLAATARSKNRTKWLAAIGARFRSFEQAPDGVLRFDLFDCDDSAFAGKGAEAKHDGTVVTSDGLSVRKEIVKIEFQARADF
jgi:hypothetical protein